MFYTGILLYQALPTFNILTKQIFTAELRCQQQQQQLVSITGSLLV